MGQIDDPSAGEGAAVIDPDHCGTAVVEVGYSHAGTEGQAAVGGRVSTGPQHFTAGGAVAVEAGSVPTGLAGASGELKQPFG